MLYWQLAKIKLFYLSSNNGFYVVFVANWNILSSLFYIQYIFLFSCYFIQALMFYTNFTLFYLSYFLCKKKN